MLNTTSISSIQQMLTSSPAKPAFFPQDPILAFTHRLKNSIQSTFKLVTFYRLNPTPHKNAILED